MTLNFSDLTRRVRAGQKVTAEDISDVLTASAAATFALMEFAAELRQQHFGTLMTVTNLPGVAADVKAGVRLEITAPLDPTTLVALLIDEGETRKALELDFVAGDSALLPMEALRIIAAARIANPARSLHLGSSREATLRSLQPLAVGAIDSLALNDSLEEPRLVFEDLKLIVGAGLTIEGAGERDLVAEYVDYLSQHGVAGAETYAQIALSGSDKTGGCGGNCACGSGGCGS
ncbi:hypothetical protein ACN082_00040 [Rothia sp. CCM 9417]|uniref:hypothetical protein n=1 Tax=Rothia sp. CCM 9417 TaxID=3402657 RepID=UPI003AE417EF